MGRPREWFGGRFVVLGIVAAVLAAPSHLPAGQPLGETPFVDEGPPLPPAPALAAEADQSPDSAEPAAARPALEPTEEEALAAAPETGAPIYPVLQEYCRCSRVYRSEILGRLWFRGEYLAWATKGVDLPALVTGSSLGTDPDLAGVLGQPDTSILFGDETIHDEISHGARLTLGYWWDTQQVAGVQASYLGMPFREVRDYWQGRGHKIVARPYFDVGTLRQDALLVAYPGLLDGSIEVQSDVELQGAEVLLRRLAVCRPGFRLDLLGGYRFGRLIDQFNAYQQSLSLDAASGYDAGSLIERYDLFKSTNDFHGGQTGLAAQWTQGCWALELISKLAVGGNFSRILVDGETVITSAGSDVYAGGLLAQPSNIGYYKEGEVAILSELGVWLRCQVRCDLSVSAGYTLLYWGRVGRAVDQIDVGLDPSQIPPQAWNGETRPAFDLNRSSFWAQGLSLCMEYQF